MPVAASKFFSLPVAEISPELEARFFSDLKTGNATFKKTDVNRFGAVDEVLADYLASNGEPEPQVLDIGISSGTTTLELKRALEAKGLSPHVTGTDQSFDAWLVSGNLGTTALMQGDGHILQFEIAGQAMRGWDRRLDRMTGRALFNAVLRRLFRGIDPVRDGRRVDLVSPRLRDASDIVLTQDDVLRRNPRFMGRFDLVRAANILNRDYFSEEQLRNALEYVRSYLKGPGSLLLLIRTDKQDGQNNGTLLRVDELGALEPVRRFGKGSEVEALIDF